MHSTGSLGIPTKLVTGYPVDGVRQGAEDRRVERYRLQAVARDVLPWERVAQCLRCMILGVEGPFLWHEPRRERARFSGLVVCGSIWICPVCACKISETRREELSLMLELGRAAGWTVALGTFTYSHNRRDGLYDSVAKLLRAFKTMQNREGYVAVRSAVGWKHSVKALEVTWGASNGWHPHIHQLMFFEPGAAGLRALESRLTDLWQRACKSVGIGCSIEHGVKLDVARENVDDYIVKMGEGRSARSWTEADELVKWHSKKAGRSVEGDQRYTPFDLLRWCRDEEGNEEPIRLFREYAVAFRRRHQLHYSRGLRAEFPEVPVTLDYQAAGQIDEDAILLALLSRSEWRQVVDRELRGTLLEVARNGDRALVVQFLAALGVAEE
jgi:Replication protein